MATTSSLPVPARPLPPARGGSAAIALAQAGAIALGAVAAGALAIGAVAIGSVALGRLGVGEVLLRRGRAQRAHVTHFTIEELTVGRLLVREFDRDRPETGK
jgi:hypothetical protein